MFYTYTDGFGCFFFLLTFWVILSWAYLITTSHLLLPQFLLLPSFSWSSPSNFTLWFHFIHFRCNSFVRHSFYIFQPSQSFKHFLFYWFNLSCFQFCLVLFFFLVFIGIWSLLLLYNLCLYLSLLIIHYLILKYMLLLFLPPIPLYFLKFVCLQKMLSLGCSKSFLFSLFNNLFPFQIFYFVL